MRTEAYIAGACGLLMIAIVVAAACDAPGIRGDWSTGCGMRVAVNGTSSRKESLELAESRALGVFASRIGYPEPRACSALSGWLLWVRPDADAGAFPSVRNGGALVGGDTDPLLSAVQLPPNAWEHGAVYPHELVHVLELSVDRKTGPDFGCSRAELEGPGGSDHCSWQRRGVWDAVQEASL